MDIQLTEHFKLSEFLFSDTLESVKASCIELYKAQNTITNEVYSNLYNLCHYVLEPVRIASGLPIHVNSGYRCYHLNKCVGGSPTSQHLKGQAADITCSDNLTLFRCLQTLEFDQLIWYGDRNHAPRFIHVSFSSGNNRKMLLFKL